MIIVKNLRGNKPLLENDIYVGRTCVHRPGLGSSVLANPFYLKDECIRYIASEKQLTKYMNESNKKLANGDDTYKSAIVEYEKEKREEVYRNYVQWLYRHIHVYETENILEELHRLLEIEETTGNLGLACWCVLPNVEVLCHANVIKAELDKVLGR